MHAGIVGAGTNNARLAGLLRGLGSYYYKEPTMLFLVRIAQGLVHMGKGLLTLNPYHTDNQLASGLPYAPSSLSVLHYTLQNPCHARRVGCMTALVIHHTLWLLHRHNRHADPVFQADSCLA